LFDDLELDLPAGLPLEHGSTVPHPAGDAHVVDQSSKVFDAMEP
jgi:hypothetical protein